MMKDGKGATQEDNDLLVEDVTKRNLSTAKIETEVDGEMDVTIPREALTCDNNQEKKKKKKKKKRRKLKKGWFRCLLLLIF